MRGYVKGNVLRLAAFFVIFGLMTASSRALDSVLLRDRNRLLSVLREEEPFLLDMLDAMERGETHDWTAEAEARGLGEFCSVDWDAVYGGAYLAEWEGFPRATGLLITREAVWPQRGDFVELEALGRGEKICLYRLTYYWD